MAVGSNPTVIAQLPELRVVEQEFETIENPVPLMPADKDEADTPPPC
jgi:hypothetical protein